MVSRVSRCETREGQIQYCNPPQNVSMNKIKSYLKYLPSTRGQHLLWITVVSPLVHWLIYPQKHPDGMFRWVYDPMNNVKLSWLTGKTRSVLQPNTKF